MSDPVNVEAARAVVRSVPEIAHDVRLCASKCEALATVLCVAQTREIIALDPEKFIELGRLMGSLQDIANQLERLAEDVGGG